MIARLGGLASLVRPVPAPIEGDGRWTSTVLRGGLQLFVGAGVIDRNDWLRFATGSAGWPTVVSRSAAAGHQAMLVADAGEVGVDIETLERVALNATAGDPWLTAVERTMVRRAARPVLELACHWVLKEAYGKALGVGLALPLGALSFGSDGGSIALAGDAAPRSCENWRFALYRNVELLFGIAYRPVRQAATPFAPAGRNPPIPLLDR